MSLKVRVFRANPIPLKVEKIENKRVLSLP